jgi:methionyl-tRNA formyltransferase
LLCEQPARLAGRPGPARPGRRDRGAGAAPAAGKKYGDEILAAARLPEERVIDGSTLREEAVVARIRSMEAELGVSILFNYILRQNLIDAFPEGVVNLHPSYLPYNRGQYPNVWSIVEGTPAGVTLHYIDAGVDTGDLIAQRTVAVEPVDTGESLYRKLEEEGLKLFRESWPAITTKTAARQPQTGGGTYHRTRDVESIDRIDLDATYTGRELLNVLRARTFPPYKGAYFEDGGRRIYVRVTLTDAQGDEVES